MAVVLVVGGVAVVVTNGCIISGETLLGSCALWRKGILLSFENKVRWQIDFGITGGGEQCFCGGG